MQLLCCNTSDEDFSSLEVRLCPATLLFRSIGIPPGYTFSSSGGTHPSNMRESSYQGPCGTGSRHFANSPGIVGAFKAVHLFIDRIFECFDSDPWRQDSFINGNLA